MALALAILATSSSGCSFIFVDGPPANHATRRHLDCTTSRVAPVLDALFAGLEVVRTGLALAADDGDYTGAPFSRGADIGLGVCFTALFAASAAYGFSETADCDAAQAALEERLARSVYDPSPSPRWWPSSSAHAPRAEPQRELEAQPIGALGYPLGAPLDHVRGVCIRGGGAFVTVTADVVRCEATATWLGRSPTTLLRFCGETLCGIEMAFAPDVPTSHAWLQRYDELRRALEQRYGAPASTQRTLPPTCTSDLRTCFATGTASYEDLWSWENGTAVWLHSSPADAWIHLDYAIVPPPAPAPPPVPAPVAPAPAEATPTDGAPAPAAAPGP